jgi:hypothetical protein
MKLSNVKLAEKPSIRVKPAEFLGTGHECKDGLLTSIKHNIYESVEMFYWDCEVIPQVFYPCYKHLFCYGICDSIIYIISVTTYIFSDRKIHCLMCVDTYSLN